MDSFFAKYISNIKYCACLLCLFMLLFTVNIVDNQWVYGMIYPKYGWFYIGIFLFLLVTNFSIWFFKTPLNHYNISLFDYIILLFLFYFSLHCLLSAVYVLSDFLFVILLFFCYFCFRYWFNIFPSLLNQGGYILLAIALIQSIWGGLQLHGFLQSYHSLFQVTGSFSNPGPYGGFLSICTPLSVYYLISTKSKIVKILALITLLAIVSILPASMSRAAWLAVIAGCGFVLFFYFHSGKYMMNYYLKNKMKSIFIGTAILISIIMLLSFFIYLKHDSAYGRLFIWKISKELLLEKGLFGVGLGNFPAMYGEQQAKYFTLSKNIYEESIADCPEYAFNEFVHIFVELGLIGFLFLVLIYYLSLRCVIKNNLCIGFGGGLVSFLVFSFFSYPFSQLPFFICFIFYLACCASANKNAGNTMLNIYKIFFMILLIITVPILKNRCQYYIALKKWNISKYNDVYEQTYIHLNDQKKFLFEYGKMLTELKQHRNAIQIFKRAQLFSCDPMFFNLEGKNHQALHEYRNAEQCFLKAHYLIPSRIYPCYLLAIMYFEEGNMEKAKYWAIYVLDRNVKIKSTAVNEIKKEMSELLLTIANYNKNE